MTQTQYRNMDKSCEGILPQGNGLHNSRKLRKAVAVYKTGKLIISNRYLKKVPKKKIEARKKVPYSKSNCSKFIFFNQPITYSMFLVSLWAIIITEKRTRITTVRSCCRTHLTLFLLGVRRSVRLCLL